MRASRLLSILIMLQLRTRLTADQLADAFEVSIRTIYRDIDALSAAGVPVYGDRGPGGGFQLIDGYRTRLTGLDRDEAEAMPMIGMPGPAVALGLGAAASRARGKLLAALPAGASHDAERFLARFHHDMADWYRAANAVPHLPVLARAVLEARVVTMTYDSWTGLRDWRVEPLGLVLKGGNWYLVASGHGKVRIFRASNIAEPVVQESSFDRPPDFDLQAYWNRELERFEAGLRPVIARLRASALGRKRLAALGEFARLAVEHAEAPDEEGWSALILPIENVDHAALMLLGIGPEIEVVEPTELRDRLYDLAQQVARRMTPVSLVRGGR